ncbi:unnamed protein product, partial [Polarella glacialis]
DSARDIAVARHFMDSEEDSEQLKPLVRETTESRIGPEDREATDATSGPLPPEDDEVDEDEYYSDVGRKSWQVIKRLAIASAAVVAVAGLLASSSSSLPRWSSKGRDVVDYQASLSGEQVCGDIYCPSAGKCCGSLCCEADATCCGGSQNGPELLCCGRGASCCNGICCNGDAVCCNGICGDKFAECERGIVIEGYLPKAEAQTALPQSVN